MDGWIYMEREQESELARGGWGGEGGVISTIVSFPAYFPSPSSLLSYPLPLGLRKPSVSPAKAAWTSSKTHVNATSVGTLADDASTSARTADQGVNFGRRETARMQGSWEFVPADVEIFGALIEAVESIKTDPEWQILIRWPLRLQYYRITVCVY